MYNVRTLLILVVCAVAVYGCRREEVRPDIIYSCDGYTLTIDSLTESGHTARAVVPMEIISDFPGNRGWRADTTDHRYPSYRSDQPIIDAVYCRSAESLSVMIPSKENTRSGSLRTRDIAYAVYLSLAALDPDASVEMLRSLVREGRILKESGVGGGWPVSTDRIAWAVAAWEVYKVTGDRKWLAEAYDIVDRALKNDLMTVWDARFSLMHGNQSGVSDEMQVYPSWAGPVDMYESMCLATNVAYSRAFAVASQMAEELDMPNDDYRGRSRTIARAINDRLWIPNYGFYSQYLYGGYFPIQAYSTDNLGQSLAILFGVASPEMAVSIISKTPQTEKGVPVMTPSKDSGDSGFLYSPITQIFWNIASSKVGNADALAAGTGALYRDLLTDPLDFRSCTSSMAFNLRVIFGMDFTRDALEFHPVILPVFAGEKHLDNFRYREAVLDITVAGTGNSIAGFTVDGVAGRDYRIPADLKGRHKVVITMANNTFGGSTVNVGKEVTLPPIPEIIWTDCRHVKIDNYNVELNYALYVNGVFQEEIGEPEFELWETDCYRVTDIAAVAVNRWVGFSARPNEYIPDDLVTIVRPGRYVTTGTRLIKDRKKGADFVELTPQRNLHLTLDAEVDTAGTYLINVHYANGNGPEGSGDKCGIRTLFVNGKRIGTVVMPQRGEGDWENTGYSNTLAAPLKAGMNIISIDYVVPYNENMNRFVNTVLVDYVRLIRR